MLRAMRRDAASRSAAREALAMAIAERDAYEAEHRAIEAAASTARTASFTATSALAAARRAVDEARITETERLVASATGAAPPTGLTLREARAAVVDAEDLVTATGDARDLLAARLRESESRRRWPSDKVKAAAVAVLGESPVAGRIAAELHALQREMLDRALVLRWLIDKGIIDAAPPAPTTSEGATAAPPARLIDARFDQAPLVWRQFDAGSFDGIEFASGRWIDALERLQNDADAEIPA